MFWRRLGEEKDFVGVRRTWDGVMIERRFFVESAVEALVCGHGAENVLLSDLSDTISIYSDSSDSSLDVT